MYTLHKMNGKLDILSETVGEWEREETVVEEFLKEKEELEEMKMDEVNKNITKLELVDAELE